MRDGRPNCLSKFGYKYISDVSFRNFNILVLTVLRELQQCIYNYFINIPHITTEEGDDQRNGRPNFLSKLGYK
jgi:hypothetical protein